MSSMAEGEWVTPGMRVDERVNAALRYPCFGGAVFAEASTKGMGSGIALPVPNCWTKMRMSIFGSHCSRAVRVRSADCEARK
jgi:hypothetical protein